jgi:hypothetical protein
LTVTLSAGWGTVTYSTQSVTTMITVRIPIEGEPSAAQRTNIISALQSALAGTRNTNVFYESSPAVVNLVGLTNTQTASGVKSFTNLAGLWSGVISNTPAISGTATALTNGVFYGSSISNATIIGGNVHSLTNGVLFSSALHEPTLTNGYNYGNAFSSPGSAAGSEEFGEGAAASGNSSTAVGKNSDAQGSSDTAIGNDAIAKDSSSTSIGHSSRAWAYRSTSLGASASVGASHTNSVAIGYGATTSQKNQIRLGTASEYVSIPGGLTVDGMVTNLITSGTNAFSDIAFRRFAITSIANGNNAAVLIGTNTFIDMSGPTAQFSINGLNGSPNRDGQMIILYNTSGQEMLIVNESGVDPIAGNRIRTAGQGTVTLNGRSSATLIYSATASRWLLVNSETSVQGFGSAGLNCSTNMVVATSASTNSLIGWDYSFSRGSIGIHTNSVLWVTNAGDYSIEFGAGLLASGSDVLKLMLFTNYVHCSITVMDATMAATPLQETGFKALLIPLPADCHVQLKVANDSPADTTVSAAFFFVHGL